MTALDAPSPAAPAHPSAAQSSDALRAPPPLPDLSRAARSRPPTSPLALVRTLVTHRDLVWQMARREVVGRYRGSVLGLLWSFFHPLLMLAVYTFAFAYVMKASPRGGMMMGATQPAPGSRAGMFEYALLAFSGLILFNLFAEVMTRSPVCILQSANYVKKVVFPLEILPFVYLVSGLIHASMSLLVLVLGQLLIVHMVPWTAVFAPLAAVPLLIFILGAGWFLASLGVYLRDVGHIMGIVTMLVMWLAPVFYPLDMLKNPIILVALRLNPLTVPMESFRDLMLYGQCPNLLWLGGYTVVACAVACGGFFFFQRTKRGFADVL
ncbi:MAG TPA: ABC transporter permease [Phycisphaerae bacterium]|jgi:lipopolysaccharide transport system permease protein|nr:ABC transporter permease [Phycisphaerae bacterium]